MNFATVEEGFARGLWWFIGLPTETVGALFLGGLLAGCPRHGGEFFLGGWNWRATSLVVVVYPLR